MILDDFCSPDGRSAAGTQWRAYSDQVMGGVSEARAARESVAGRPCLHLHGDVRLEHGGGFIQAALPLAYAGTFDASRFEGVVLEVRGNGETYAVHLKTSDLGRPWAYYTAVFDAPSAWRTVRLPFSAFDPKSTNHPLRTERLTQLGIVAIGRAFHADLYIARVGFFLDAGASEVHR